MVQELLDLDDFPVAFFETVFQSFRGGFGFALDTVRRCMVDKRLETLG